MKHVVSEGREVSGVLILGNAKIVVKIPTGKKSTRRQDEPKAIHIQNTAQEQDERISNLWVFFSV